jgi:hypothetical protein
MNDWMGHVCKRGILSTWVETDVSDDLAEVRWSADDKEDVETFSKDAF